MIRIQKYDPEKTYLLGSGKVADAEFFKREYPAFFISDVYIETDESGLVFMSYYLTLAAACDLYGVDPALPEADAIAELERIRNTPPVIDNAPSAEERTAAALEFQNMLALASMMTEEGGEPI